MLLPSWFRFASTAFVLVVLVGCTRPERERMCDEPMDLTPPYISEATIIVSPTLPDENGEVRVSMTLQAGFNCDPETLELCGVRLVDRTNGERLVDLDLAFPEEFDGLLECPEAQPLDLVDLGTSNDELSARCRAGRGALLGRVSGPHLYRLGRRFARLHFLIQRIRLFS